MMSLNILVNVVGSTVNRGVAYVIEFFFRFKKKIVFIDDITLTAEQEIESNTDWILKIEDKTEENQNGEI